VAFIYQEPQAANNSLDNLLAPPPETGSAIASSFTSNVISITEHVNPPPASQTIGPILPILDVV